MRLTKVILAAAGVFLFTSAARGETDTVLVRDFNFFPASLAIRPGDKVVWKVTQECCFAHTTTRSASPMSWNSGPLALGETFELVFFDAGTFNYFCTPHQAIGMTGSIRVEPIKAPTFGWLGLCLLAGSLTAAGIYVLGYKRQTA